ncbi:MAG: hypothetical protein ACK4UP_05575 [Spirosomataceae bacterium]
MTESIKSFIASQLPSNVSFGILATNIRAVLNTLTDWVANVLTGNTYFQASVVATSSNAITITHNLNLTEPNNMIVQVRNATDGRIETVDVINATANTVQIRIYKGAYPTTCRVLVFGSSNPQYVIRRHLIRTELLTHTVNEEAKDAILVMSSNGAKSVTIDANFPVNSELTLVNASSSGNISVTFPGGVLGNYASNQAFTVQPNNGSQSFTVPQVSFTGRITAIRTDAGFWVFV